MDWGAKSAAALGLGHGIGLCWDAGGGLALLWYSDFGLLYLERIEELELLRFM